MVATFDADSTVDREAAVGPGQDIVHRWSIDPPLLEEHPEHLASEKVLDLLRVEVEKVPKAAVGEPHTICHQHVNMGMKSNKLAGRLEKGRLMR